MVSTQDVISGIGLIGAVGLLSRSGKAKQAPTSKFNWSPQNPIDGDTIQIDGSPSTDPDGIIVSYDWHVQGQTLSGQQIEIDANGVGPISVILTVTDNDGLTDTNSATINVSGTNESPVASFDFSPLNPVVGDTVSLDATPSNDPDGTIVTYTWTIAGATIDGRTAQFTANTLGDVNVSLEVIDNDGNVDTISSTISIGEPPEFQYGAGGFGEHVS